VSTPGMVLRYSCSDLEGPDQFAGIGATLKETGVFSILVFALRALISTSSNSTVSRESFSS